MKKKAENVIRRGVKQKGLGLFVNIFRQERNV